MKVFKITFTLLFQVLLLKISVIRKREVGVKKKTNKIRLYSLYIYLKYSCRIPIKVYIDFLLTLIVFITCPFFLIFTLFCSPFFFLWPLPWHHPFFLLLPLSWPYFDGSLKYHFDDFFIFLVVLTFVFKSKANIFCQWLNRFLLVSLRSSSLNFYWTSFDISAGNSKTLSVKSTLSFSLSKSSSNSLDISLNMNVLSALGSGSICGGKPNRFSGVLTDFSA